jgi:hypothetical protein
LVVATHGISEEVLHAMRLACDKVGVRTRKAMERERADAEKRRAKHKRDAKADDALLLEDSDSEATGGEDADYGAGMVVDPPAPPPSPAHVPSQLMSASQEAPFVTVSQEKERPTLITIRRPPATPPPAKRRAIGDASVLLALASQLEQIEQSQPLVEDLRAAETDPATWHRYALEMLALESKYVEGEYKTLRDNAATAAKKIFRGGAVPLTWPLCYSFLHTADADHYRDHLLIPYYRDLPDHVRGGVPKGELDALLMGHEEIMELYRKAWTLAAAIASGPASSPHFRHLANYYPGLAWPDNADDALAQIRRILPSLLRSGAPAPLAFPATSHAMRVRTAFLYPELLFEQPLPFPTTRTADLGDYTNTLEALVTADPYGFGNLRRASTGEIGESELYAGTLGLFEDNHDPETARQLTAALVEPRRQAREEEDRNNIPFLTKWAERREKHVKEQLIAQGKDYKGGRYPGLLAPDRTGALDRAMARSPPAPPPPLMIPCQANTFDRMMRLTSAQVAAADPNMPAAERDAMEQAAERDLARAEAEYVAQLHYITAQGGEVVDPLQGHRTEDSKALSEELMQQFQRCRAMSGRIGTLDDRLFEKSDELKMRAISEALNAQWEATHRHLSPEVRDAELFKHREARARTVWECIERSREESEAMIKMEASLRRLLDAGPHMIPTQDLVNNDPWTTFLVWLESTLQQPFQVCPAHPRLVLIAIQVAMKNWQTTLICFFAAKTALICPDFFSGEPLLNVSLEGKEMSGKSRQLWLVHATHLEGACINAASISPQSYTDGGNNSNHIVLQQEAPHDQLIDPYDGKRHGTDVGANPQKANIMKTMLTEFIASAITLRLDPQTGQRIRSMFLSRASNVFFQCANWDIGGNAPAPILSRYIRIELQRPSTKEAAADVQGQARPRGVEDVAVITAIARFFHLFHGMYLKTERMISAGGIVDVQKDMGMYMQLDVESHLKAELGVPQANVTARKGQQTLLLARELCMGEAIFRLLALREGRDWLAHHRIRSPFSWEAILGFISPLLKIQAHHISYAMTLLGFQIVSQVDTDAITALAMIAKAQDPKQREPLLTEEREFPGDPGVARALGLFGTPNAADGANGAHPLPPQHGTLQADYGWICLKAASEEVLVNTLAQVVYDKIKIMPLANQLRGILRAKMDLTIDSRYYRRDAGGDIVAIADNDGTFQIRRIPAMRWGIESGANRAHKAKYWIAINIDYLQKHHAIPIARGAAKEIIDDIAGGLSDDEKDRYRDKVNMPLSKRLDIEEVSFSDAIKPDFINRLCEVDVLRHPIAHAIRMALENPVLGLARQRYEPGVTAISDKFCTEYKMLLFVQPPDIKLRIEVPAVVEGTTVPRMVTKVRAPAPRSPLPRSPVQGGISSLGLCATTPYDQTQRGTGDTNLPQREPTARTRRVDDQALTGRGSRRQQSLHSLVHRAGTFPLHGLRRNLRAPARRGARPRPPPRFILRQAAHSSAHHYESGTAAVGARPDVRPCTTTLPAAATRAVGRARHGASRCSADGSATR